MPRLSDFTTLTFDCYGTLIDWERGMLAELGPWRARHGLTATDADLLAAFAEAETRCEAETPTALYPSILARTHVRMAQHFGAPADQEEADRFGASVGRWPAFADTPGALAYLKRHYRLVVVSNVDRASFAMTREHLGVTFDRVITAEEVGSYKPHPGNFLYALRELRDAFGVEPEEVLHTAQEGFGYLSHDLLVYVASQLKTPLSTVSSSKLIV